MRPDETLASSDIGEAASDSECPTHPKQVSDTFLLLGWQSIHLAITPVK